MTPHEPFAHLRPTRQAQFGVTLLVAALLLSPARAADAPAAADFLPVWASVEAASARAAALDRIHAVVTTVVRRRQLNPLRAARLFAAIRVAQAEAVRQVVDEEADAVAGLAASWALSWMLPQEDSASWVVPSLMDASSSGGLTEEAERRVHAAVWPVLAHVIEDGADARRRPLLKPDPKPGTWLRTPPLFAEQPTEPQGANWRPWCAGTERLEAAPPVQPGTSAWHTELKQVAETTVNLTAEQRSIAQRWHLDAGSITPPGVWNAIATSFLEQQRLPVVRRQRVLAVLNMAMQDALVATWRVKLRYWSERPITAIRRELDPAFEPLLVTPPFPGYVSGHSAVSAAAAGVLSDYFPEEAWRWHVLAREAAVSRLYGGIHFVSDNEQGLALGLRVAQACVAAFGRSNFGGATTRLVNAPEGMSAGFFVPPHRRARPE